MKSFQLSAISGQLKKGVIGAKCGKCNEMVNICAQTCAQFTKPKKKV